MPGLTTQIEQGSGVSPAPSQAVLRRKKRAGSSKESSAGSSREQAGSSDSDLSATDIAEIERLLDSHSGDIDLISVSKLIAYADRNDKSLEKILTSGSDRAVNSMPSDTLAAYAHKGDSHIGKILSSGCEKAIRLIPRDKLVAYASKNDNNIEKILDSNSDKAISLIPNDKLIAYARKSDSHIGKILSSGCEKAVRLIPRDKLAAYAGRSSSNIDKILSSNSERAIDLIPDSKLVAYARKDSSNIEKILNSESIRLTELIPSDKLADYAKASDSNLEKILNSQSIKTIDLIPGGQLVAYARKGNRCIEKILNTRSMKAIDFIPNSRLKAYVNQNDDHVEKILNSQSAKAIALISAEKLIAYARLGDDYIETILGSGSDKAIDVISEQLKAYADQGGDYYIETILGSGSDRAVDVIADQLKAYATQGDYYIETILSYRFDKAIDVIAEQLKSYASKNNENIEKILNSQLGRAIRFIPSDKLVAYASQGNQYIETILNSGSELTIDLIPADKLSAYANQGDQYIETILSAGSDRAIDLIPVNKVDAYVRRGGKNIEKILSSRASIVIDLVPEDLLKTYASKGNENIEKILNSQSYRAINFISADKLAAYASQGDQHIEIILSSGSDRAIELIPDAKLIIYASQSDSNIEKILNSKSDKAIKLIPHKQITSYANTIRRRFQQVSSAQSSLDDSFSEECLPGPSGYRPPSRGRREALSALCEFSWEDVDKFNEETEQLREFKEIKINSEKFLSLLESPAMPESKRMQLLQLADKVFVTGAAKDRVLNLVQQQKTVLYLNKLSRVTGVATYGMITENVLRDFLQEDYQGVAINLGFVAGGIGFNRVAEAAAIKGEELVVNNQRLLGQSLKLASPFLARGSSSAFVVYDLVNQIKGYRQGNPDALLGVGADSVYLTLDASEIGIETAELFGLFEGVSSVTGPIGAATGALVFIGTDVYLAVKQVNKEDVLIHLTHAQKLEETLRAFIGMTPKHDIEMLLEEKQTNNQLYLQGLSFLKNHPNIQRYILPTAKIEQKYEVKWTKEECVSNYGGAGKYICHPPKLESQGCEITGWELNLDNIVMLDKQRENITRSRTKPDVSEGNLFCVPVAPIPEEEQQEQSSKGRKVSSFTRTNVDEHLRSIETLMDDLIKISNKEQGITAHEDAYFCDQAMGIGYAESRTGNMTLMVLGDGDDTVEGFPYGDHLLMLGNGHKDISLGAGDDTFLLQGNITTGTLLGGGGINTLDLGSFAKEQKLVAVAKKGGYFSGESQGTLWAQSTLSNAQHLYSSDPTSTSNPLEINQIHRVLLRADKRDYMEVACYNHFIDARGGEGGAKPVETMDMIVIPEDEHCVYDLTLMIRMDTYIGNYNNRENSQFTYIVPLINKGYAGIFLSSSDGSHRFMFENTLLDIQAIKWLPDNRVIFYLGKLPSRFKFEISMKETNHRLLYQLSDNTEIKVLGDHFYAFQNTNRSVEEIIKDYPSMAERLKLTMIVQSSLSNESIAIAHGKHDVLHNDPYRRSHLLGNGGENIYVITSGYDVLDESKLPLPEVVLHDGDNKNLINTLDLRRIRNQLQSNLNVKVQARVRLVVDTHDVAIDLFTSRHALEKFITVRLKEALLTNWHKKLHVILNHVPMELSSFALKPLPLAFSHDKNIIIINPNDVDQNTQLVIAKRAGDYHFYRLKTDLMLTNAFATNITETERYTFLFQAFYQTKKLENLFIKFVDKELMLKNEIDTIKHAADFLSKRERFNRAMHDTLFNKKGIGADQTLVRRARGIEEEKELKEEKTLWGRFRSFIVRMNQIGVLDHSNNDVTSPLDIAEQRVRKVIPINESNHHRTSWAVKGNASTFFQSVLPSAANYSQIHAPQNQYLLIGRN